MFHTILMWTKVYLVDHIVPLRDSRRTNDLYPLPLIENDILLVKNLQMLATRANRQGLNSQLELLRLCMGISYYFVISFFVKVA